MEYAIGCDVGGSFVKMGLVARGGEVLHQENLPLLRPETPFRLATWLSETLEKFLKKTLPKGATFLGAGIGIPGPLRYPEGILFDPPNLPFQGKIPLGPLFREVYPHAAFFDNDATIQTLGEQWQGLGRGLRAFLYLAFGTGIGGGIVIDGKIYRGISGFGGEIGHITVNFQGRRCHCGARGCMEAYASITGIANSLREEYPHLPPDISKALERKELHLLPNLLVDKLSRGETQWRRVWEIFADALGAGMGSLINLFNPERIIISGGLSHYADHFLPRAVEQSRRFSFRHPARDCNVVVSQLKNRAGILGAALLVFQNG